MLKPRLVLSACLNLEKTRYDGKLIENPLAIKIRNFCEIISVCPEVGIGLSVPRKKIILYKKDEEIKAVEIFTGKNLTEKLRSFSKKFIQNLPEVEGFFLKARSPSCGVSYKTKTYEDINGEHLCGYSQGIFTKEVLKAFPFLPVVDEEILANKDELENFLIRVFALRKLREFKEKAKSNEDIVSFHKKAYYLLKGYDPLVPFEIKENLFSKNTEFKEVLKRYEEYFKKTLAQPFNREKQVDSILVLLHSFLKFLKEKERRLIFHYVESYKNGEISLIKLVKELKIYLPEKEILDFFLELYPEELLSK